MTPRFPHGLLSWPAARSDSKAVGMGKAVDPNRYTAIAALYEQGLSMEAVATRAACSRKVVRRALAVVGALPRPRTAPKARRDGSLPIVFEGKGFASLAALARHLGHHDSGAAMRGVIKRRGASLQDLTSRDVVPTPRTGRPSPVAVPYELEGMVYASIVAACRVHRQTRSAVEHRLARGWTPRQAFGMDPPPSRTRNRGLHTELLDGRLLPLTEPGGYKLYEIRNLRDGKFYIGITVTSLAARMSGHLQNAKNPERKSHLYNAMRLHGSDCFEIRLLRCDARNALELQQQEIDEIAARNAIAEGYNVAHGGSVGTSRTCRVGKLVYPSQGAAAEAYGIPAKIFNQRLRKGRWTPEQAAEIEPRPGGHRHRRITVGGVPYASCAEAARALGVTAAVALERMRRGATAEEAFGLASLPPNFRRIGRVTVGGDVFPDMKSAAAARGLSPVTVNRRLARGATLEQALGYEAVPVHRGRREPFVKGETSRRQGKT